MERWGKGSRKEVDIADIDRIVSKEYLLWKIERVMDHEYMNG